MAGTLCELIPLVSDFSMAHWSDRSRVNLVEKLELEGKTMGDGQSPEFVNQA